MDHLEKLSESTKKNILAYLNSNYDQKVKDEIRDTLQRNPKALENAFYKKLSFGTGGIRGIMGMGTNRINEYTIRTAALGLANHLLKENRGKKITVLIGYDNRKNSSFFATECARVFAQNNITALLFKHLCPTPLVSFGIRLKGCSAGVMITASHNPPEYNGFKVYGEDGAQVIFPEDKKITEEIERIEDPSSIKLSLLDDPLIKIVSEEIIDAYLDRLKKLQNSKGSPLQVIYTSLHGTGAKIVPRALQEWGYDVRLVQKQCQEDENFTFAKNPNPENITALQMGIDLLLKTRGDLFLATDPDADRLAVVVAHEGKSFVLSGNQTAVILLDYLLANLSSKKLLKDNAAFIKTIVTTELFSKIVQTYHKKCFEVLTGFKYIAALIKEWEKSGSFSFVFGAEESLGYLIDDFVRDKDSISAACVIAEIASLKKQDGKTLIHYLNEIFQKYGLFKEELFSIDFEEGNAGMKKMETIMNGLRTQPFKSLAGIELLTIEDYKKRESHDLKNNKKTALSLPTSDALRFWLFDHSKIVIRPSGTEPKMKIYIGVQMESFSNLQEASDQLDKKIYELITDLKRIISV